MTPRELAAAIRKGHTMIGESRSTFIAHNGSCGCALGAAWVAIGKSEVDYHGNNERTFAYIAKVLGIATDLAKEISDIHAGSQKTRLEIADWLDTLDVSKPKDRQTFDDFMAKTLVAVEVEQSVSSPIDSLAK